VAEPKKKTTGGFSGIPATTVTPKTVPSNKKATTSTDKEILKSLSGLSKSLGSLSGIVGGLGGAATTTATQPSGPTEAEKFAAQQALLLKQQQDAAAAQALQNRKSAFDLLREQFAQYGLEALVDPLQGLIQENISPSEFAVRLRQTEPYKKRFAANAARIGKGLRALSEAEYLSLEDGYQSIMRNYGLPASYYAKGDLGRQEGFEKLIAGDVSAAELEDRVMTAQNRVINAPPQVKDALKQFYPDINNSEILAYTLDPEKGLADIKRKITAAEIGGAAIGAGLATDVGRAEELAKFGVTAERAREGYQAAVPIIERGRQLSGFYGESPYTQRTAEEELFGLTGAPEASAKRKRLTSLEQAQFAGSSGLTGGALSRDRAGAY
jgi:type II secretory pathway pseudopilin PulG